ncbi:MAG: metallophosphoesterase family protein, partial [Clostridia bacterium]|nr:metallophosphoesterase family protein [Clostridia bacterium]
MKLLIASDLHGGADACQKLCEIFAQSGADKLVLLGDILYHG